MQTPDEFAATQKIFFKAIAALAMSGLLLATGCSKAPEEEIVLPAWLTEGDGANGSESGNELGDPQPDMGTASDSYAQNDAFGRPQPFSPPHQLGTLGQSAPMTSPAETQHGNGLQAGVGTSQMVSAQGTYPSGAITAPQMQTAGALDKVQLKLNLQQGMRLPLRKIVETELTQGGENGLPEVHRSRLEIGLILSVEEQRAGQTRLGVRYNNIKLTRDAGGRRLEFDSANSILQTSSSPELLAYKTMVGDGFSYWVSDDNKVVGVEGFHEFMNRCLGHMHDAAQRAAMLGIEGSSEDGLADFVDSTIGLLPYNSAKAIGEQWSREISIGRPVPMKRTETYTLKDFDPVVATVQVSAKISPSTSVGRQQLDDGGVRVVIEGGHLHGESEIFRDTGLPKHSQTTESLNMLVQMSGGVEFRQTKQTTTTIAAYPPQNIR